MTSTNQAIPAEAVESACTCEEAFGQIIHDSGCTTHGRCEVMMRGIPIRCILVNNHKGDHK